MGRSAVFETDLRCSQNLSPGLLPVSLMYDRVHAGQVMIYMRLLVVHENLCCMVRGTPGVLIWEAGLVWAQVLHRGRRQGKVPFGSSSGLKVAADQGITQVGVAAVRAEYSRVIKQFLIFRVRF